MFQHINGLTNRESFFERLKKILAPSEYEALLRRLYRRRVRDRKRRDRHASYPYASKRQNARYARQIAAGQLKFA